MGLEALKHKRLNGTEYFHNAGENLGFNVGDFWSWSVSDLVSNTTRGILAEYIVGRAVSADLEIRDEWGPYDLRTPEGTRIEVKSAAISRAVFKKGFPRYPSIVKNINTGILRVTNQGMKPEDFPMSMCSPCWAIRIKRR